MHLQLRSGAARFGVLPMAVVTMTVGLAAASRSAAAVEPPAPHNISASPWFWEACSEQGSDSEACIEQTVAAIDHARQAEHMSHSALVLPDNFRTLTSAEQTFVLVDLERVDRGLRPIAGLVPELNVAAQPGAIKQVDPTPATSQLQGLGVRQYRTLWARAFGPLASDYEWMYDDGYSADGDSNVDCQSPGAGGCWSHRRAILTTFSGQRLLLAGAASASQPEGFASISAILTAGSPQELHFIYTWRDALRHGADRL